MNGNSFDVRDVGWGRIAPLVSARELPHAVQLSPSLSSVGTSKKQGRLRTRIDNHRIGRVECQRKYLAFLQSLKLPGFSPVGAFVDAAFSAGQETPFVTWARRHDNAVIETRNKFLRLQINHKNSLALHGDQKFPRPFHFTSSLSFVSPAAHFLSSNRFRRSGLCRQSRPQVVHK